VGKTLSKAVLTYTWSA